MHRICEVDVFACRSVLLAELDERYAAFQRGTDTAEKFLTPVSRAVGYEI
jgi:hypothetical protein